jgi:colicin import membrane protein
MKNKLWISALALPFVLVACEKKTEADQAVDKAQEDLKEAVEMAVDSGKLTPEQKQQLEAAQKEAQKQLENLTPEQKQAIAEAQKQYENLTPDQKKAIEDAQKQAAEAIKNAGNSAEDVQKAIKEAQEKAAKAIQGQ